MIRFAILTAACALCVHLALWGVDHAAVFTGAIDRNFRVTGGAVCVPRVDVGADSGVQLIPFDLRPRQDAPDDDDTPATGDL
jgi:hypothetical protein